jgi:Fe-S cluster assembly protein SufD
MTTLPTRKQEDWRYADLKALATLWPLPAPEQAIVPAGSSFERLIVIDGAQPQVQQLDLSLGRGARASVRLVNLAQSYGRLTLNVTLHDHADFELRAVQIGSGDESLEIVSKVHHVEPRATSRQIVRSVLAQRAAGSFMGRIEVAPLAQKTDAQQSSKALLLARTATANSKPELLIHADDVKCAHGATVGELDRNALFYLGARGLDPQAARALLIEAFIADALDGITDDALRAAVMTKLAGALHHA